MTLNFAAPYISVADAEGNTVAYNKVEDTVTAGTVIKYKITTDGSISEILGVYDVSCTDYAENDTSTAATVAISSLDPIAFNGMEKANGRFWDLEDAVVLYVNNAERKEADGGSLELADKNGDGLVSNAFVLFNNQTARVDLILVDVNNDIAGVL